MSRFFLFILILSFGTNIFSQKITPFKSWNKGILAKANSARNNEDLSFQEKKVVFYINLARINGPLFSETYLKDYMEDVRIPKNKYYRSLVKTLKEQEILSPLQPQSDLIKEAMKHAKEMGRTGKKGHRSANHKSFEERTKKLRFKYKKVKENNQYGYPDALSIVIDLLIDDDKESLIHRRTLLHEDLKYVGVGLRAHKKYQVNTSLIFGGEIITPQ